MSDATMVDMLEYPMVNLRDISMDLCLAVMWVNWLVGLLDSSLAGKTEYELAHLTVEKKGRLMAENLAKLSEIKLAGLSAMPTVAQMAVKRVIATAGQREFQ